MEPLKYYGVTDRCIITLMYTEEMVTVIIRIEHPPTDKIYNSNAGKFNNSSPLKH